jgi:multisubunit Na+/H+ antiporter MnhB subunit
MIIQTLDIGLAALVLTLAGWTVLAHGTFPAVVSYVAYGLLLSLIWVRLFAVDVALTEAAIGGGVTGVLLIGAASKLRKAVPSPAEREVNPPLKWAIAALCALATLALAAVVLLLPDPSPTLAPETVQSIDATGLGNPVTAVLIAYRAFDTMLEKCVLVLAVVGVWSLAADRHWGGAPGAPRAVTWDGALTFFAQLLPALGILIGIRIFWIGADEPGGAFQGGAILAAMWMIIMMARLADAPAIGERWMRIALAAGPIVFLGVGILGFVAAWGFLAYPARFAKPLIIFVEIFMTLSIAATLPMLVAGPPIRAPRP